MDFTTFKGQLHPVDHDAALRLYELYLQAKVGASTPTPLTNGLPPNDHRKWQKYEEGTLRMEYLGGPRGSRSFAAFAKKYG